MITRNNAYTFIAFIVLLSLDQATKLFLMEYIKTLPEQQIYVLPFFKLIYSWNYGISFGMFSDYQHSNVLFLLLNSFVIVYLCHYTHEIHDALQRKSVYLIITGAMGNLIDRLFHDGVFDFLHFHIGDYAFPTFNLADSYISVGAAIYIYRSIFCTSK